MHYSLILSSVLCLYVVVYYMWIIRTVARLIRGVGTLDWFINRLSLAWKPEIWLISCESCEQILLRCVQTVVYYVII
jgi:hypothetical protein